MNYYEHHIGDYDADTAHLSWSEDMAYTRLLRLYYRKEAPIPADVGQACRLVRATSKDERKAVESVLQEFFELREDGWHQSRCDGEIGKYQSRVAHNREVGKKGGRPRKTETRKEPEQNPPGYFREPEQNPPQTPDPIHQGSVPIGTDATDAASGKTPMEKRKAEAWKAVKSLLNEHGMPKAQTGAFIGKLVSDYGEPVVLNAMEAAVMQRPAEPDAWLVAACRHSAGQRVPPHSFAERDREAGMQRWEQMTGRVHPDRSPSPTRIVDVTPAVLPALESNR